MTAPISNGPTTHGYTTMRDATGPSGALHIGGVGCADVLLGPSNFACNSLGVISNHEFTPLGFQRFLTLLKILPIELHATYG